MHSSALMLLAAAVSSLGCFSKTCTSIGCRDQASISIRNQSGSRPELLLRLDIDGAVVDCAAPLGTASHACSDGQVTVSSRELQACVEERTGNARILRCSGTGRFEQVVDIAGNPATIRVTVIDPATGTAVDDRTFKPQYAVTQPNGSDCEPTCHQWGTEWLLA